MIVIKAELWPGGDEASAVDLGRMVITNDLQGSLSSDLRGGHYDVRIEKGKLYSSRGGIWKSGKVIGFPRTSKRVGPWELLFLALKACGVDKRARFAEQEGRVD